MRDINTELNDLLQIHGPELMLQACKSIIAKYPTSSEITVKVDPIEVKPTPIPTIPKEYAVLVPGQIAETVDDLLVAANGLVECSDENYQRKGEIMSRLKMLETEILLKDAEALMQVGDGTACLDDGRIIKLSNAEMRDAYRRQFSADLRRERATLEGELEKINAQQTENSQRRREFITASECQMRKAGLQTALLNFLARG